MVEAMKLLKHYIESGETFNMRSFKVSTLNLQ
jgi:hypothetical protein